MGRYWLWWFIAAFTTFIIPETAALLRGRDQDTLSAAIWRLEDLRNSQNIWNWNAAHFLFTGAFILITAWLVGHFGWGLWR